MDLSIVIPARNEMFLNRTVDDILSNIESKKTEIIVVLDGQWPSEPIKQNNRVTVLYLPKAVGQRGATNRGVGISSAKYVMKCDAHCSFDKGFDVKMMEDMQDDWTMVPKMYNLHVFDWVCDCGHRRYQGPTKPCDKCGEEMRRDIIWNAKKNPESTSFRFDRDLKFQYWGAYKKNQEGDLVETMSLLGACWMLTREKYWELDICDEGHGGWGQQGTEVACKTWLSGGKLICTKKTWFAHMFRTQGGDFGFPYKITGREVNKARKYSRDLWLNDKWPKAKHKLDWLIDKFNPPDWESSKSKGIVFYTDNKLPLKIAHRVQKNLKRMNIPIVSVSLKKMDFGNNVHLKRNRGYLTLFKQILAGLEASESEIIFFCEHDIIYHPSHFSFTPERRDVFYYNENVWKVRIRDGHAVHYPCKQTSGLCAYRELLIEHYKKRVEVVEAWGYTRKIGFEPGTHNRKERIDEYGSKGWMSEHPNIDLRHNNNLTPSRWNPNDFRKKPKSWVESKEIPFWGKTSEFLGKIIGI